MRTQAHRIVDTDPNVPLPAMFSKLDSLTPFLAPLLPAPASTRRPALLVPQLLCPWP